MGAKTILISSITLVAIAIIIVLLFFISESSFQSPTNLEECKTAAFNGENKVNLVFFATKENTQKYSNFFLQTSPFNKNNISLNSKHQSSVLTHEFGHVFANLADEYIPAIIPKGSKNCASSCDNFPENIDGCFQGCSKDNYYRSIDKGVMRTLSTNSYGILNENIVSEKIPKQNTLTGQAPSDLNAECSEQEYYLIKGFVKNSKIEIQQQTIEILDNNQQQIQQVNFEELSSFPCKI